MYLVNDRWLDLNTRYVEKEKDSPNAAKVDAELQEMSNNSNDDSENYADCNTDGDEEDSDEENYRFHIDLTWSTKTVKAVKLSRASPDQ